MNIVDIGIIIFILFGGLLGFKRGFTKQLIQTIGSILVIVLAFKIKNPVSSFLYQTLPFFKFGGVFKGVSVLNIVLYEFIAFLIVVSLLGILLRVLLFASSIFETLLNMTIVLGIPSKIMGFLIGLVQNYIIVFIALYLLSLPIINFEPLNTSKYKNDILTKTPILAKLGDKSLTIVADFKELKNKYKDIKEPDQFNLDAIDLLLSKKIVQVSSIDKLVTKGKLQINNIESVLQKYR